jgi:hypothetical protein
VVDRRPAPRLVRPDLHEPLDRAAVELDLVDRLAGANLAQLGRPVGGQHDQRHARVPGLDDRGEEVGRGGAGRARDDHRSARSLGHAEREEAGAALVEDRDRLELRPRGERERERGVARAGRGHGVPDAAANELVDEGLHRRVGPVDRLHGAAR